MMHAALLYDLSGTTDATQIESDLDGEFPAVDAAATQYLDGKKLCHGEAAARIQEEQELPMVQHTEIVTEQFERSRKTLVEWYADLEDGWAGITSTDGEWFVEEWLSVHYGLTGIRLTLDLEVWIEHFLQERDASVWGLTYSVEVDDEPTRAGSQFHRDASIEQLERDAADVSGVGFYYPWNGHARGVIYESGYAAIYRDWTEAEFGRWLSEHVLPYAAHHTMDADTTQSTLGSSDEPDDQREESEA